MSRSWGKFFYPHEISVRDLRAGGGMGSSYAEARTLAAEVKDEQQLIRADDGSEMVSSTQVTIPLYPVKGGPAAHVPAGSLVTVWPGTPAARQAQVLAVARNENAPPLDSFIVLSLK